MSNDATDTSQDAAPQAVQTSRATMMEPGFAQQNGESTATNEDANSTTAEDSSQQATDNQDSDRKYAGRYKSIEELEKGYKELQSQFTQLSQKLAENTSTQQQEQNVPDGYDPEVAKSLEPYLEKYAQPLVEKLTQQEYDRAWSELRQEFGSDIQERVAAKFKELTPEEQATLDNPAGARTIARMLEMEKKLQNQRTDAATQPTGAPKTHKPTGPNLTREQILAMSPQEYEARRAEIEAFYMSQYGQR